MVTMVDDLVSQEEPAQAAGQWDLQKAVTQVQQEVPPSLQQLIEQQIERLGVDVQRVLEVASVAGLDFSAAAVAAALEVNVTWVEEMGAALARQHLFLEPDGKHTDRERRQAEHYRFRHALYQSVVYERVTLARQRLFHQRIGEWKEAIYGERTHEMAAELAVHFEQGRDYPRAMHYLRHAGENAQRRNAHAEAISLLTKALKLLPLLPDIPERLQQESGLYIMLGTLLIALKGYAAPEVEHTLTRARELCLHLGDTRRLIPVTQGLCFMHYNRAEFYTARSLAEQLLCLAHSLSESASLPGVYAILGQVLFALGEFGLVQEHATQGVALYNARQHSPHVSPVAHDPGVNCLATQARALWHLGYPDQALRCGHEALALARTLSHSVSLTLALNSAVALHHWRGEWYAAQELGEELLTLAQRQAFPHWAGWGMMLRGLILARQAQLEEGITQMRQGFAALTTTGAKMGLTGLSCELAWAYEKAGRATEGLPLLAEALAMADKTGEHFALAELYRLKGQLLLNAERGTLQNAERGMMNDELKTPQPSNSSLSIHRSAKAEACFHKAIEIAQRQNAKSLELRATMSLVCLWQRQGKRAVARKTLAEIYHWFSEGFDTKDLKEASTLLAQLA